MVTALTLEGTLRLEGQTKATGEAQAAPQNQQASILNDMTGENLTGDMLTATLWGYFVNVQNYGMVEESQAQVYDRPALSYGLFHAVAQPNKTYVFSLPASASKA